MKAQRLFFTAVAAVFLSGPNIGLAEETIDAALAVEGDGSADDLTCKSNGIRPGSQGYVDCRNQLIRTKQLADEQQAAQARAADEQRAAQKAARDAAAQKAIADFNKFKKCAEETRNPACINNAGVAAQNLGSIEHAKSWYTMAARYGEPNAISNLKKLGAPVPEPDLLRQQQQAQTDYQSNQGSKLFAAGLIGIINAIGKNSANTPDAVARILTDQPSAEQTHTEQTPDKQIPAEQTTIRQTQIQQIPAEQTTIRQTQIQQAPSHVATPSQISTNGNAGYKSSSGTTYQYDLSQPADRVRYSVDPAAQIRDSINVNPMVNIDRSIGQVGGGVQR